MTRERLARRLVPALLLVPLLVLAGCGQNGRNGAASADKADKVEAARAYARCMRDNGVPDFPDPDANGQLRGPGHEQKDTPKFKAAQEQCRNLAPGAEHQRSDPATVEQLRRFSQCMRDNGLPDYPDPDPNGRPGAGHEAFDRDDPKVKAAMETCRQQLPGGGDHR